MARMKTKVACFFYETERTLTGGVSSQLMESLSAEIGGKDSSEVECVPGAVGRWFNQGEENSNRGCLDGDEVALGPVTYVGA